MIQVVSLSVEGFVINLGEKTGTKLNLDIESIYTGPCVKELLKYIIFNEHLTLYFPTLLSVYFSTCLSSQKQCFQHDDYHIQSISHTLIHKDFVRWLQSSWWSHSQSQSRWTELDPTETINTEDRDKRLQVTDEFSWDRSLQRNSLIRRARLGFLSFSFQNWSTFRADLVYGFCLVLDLWNYKTAAPPFTRYLLLYELFICCQMDATL